MQTQAKPRGAIIIAGGNPRTLPACVEALRRCAIERPDLASRFEVSIAADEGVPNLLPAGFAGTSFIRTRSRHPGHKRNIAVSRTNARYLFFIDDDTLPDSRWLESADRICREKHEVVAGRSTPPAAVNDRQKVLQAILGSRMVTGGPGYLAPLDGKIRFYDIYLCNACVRRDVFEAVGGFVEKAPYTMDDTEFFHLCEILGVPLSADNSFVIRHGFTDLWRPYLRKNIERHRWTGICRQLFPDIYRQIPVITAADWSPVLLAGAILTAPLSIPVYAAVMAAEGLRRGLDLRRTAMFVAAAALHHATALYAYNAGRIGAVTGRIGCEEGLDETVRRRAAARSKTRSGK
ncbi:glycosyltransferase [Candidatus Fermentibacteria bacterium]|nr:glycosyltransferase [Candidatus Fermentibacteria bacterium]